MTELRECPFCDGPVKIKAGEVFDGFVCQGESVCLGSGLIQVFMPEDREKAIACWNTRSTKATAAPQGDASEREGLAVELDRTAKWLDGSGSAILNLTSTRLRRAADLLRAAATALSAPEGWRLVPVDPTDKMRAAAFDYLNSQGEEVYMVAGIYRAMVNAAPQPVTPRKP